MVFVLFCFSEGGVLGIGLTSPPVYVESLYQLNRLPSSDLVVCFISKTGLIGRTFHVFNETALAFNTLFDPQIN